MLKATRVDKEPHELAIGEWCYFHGDIYAECPGGLTANLSLHSTRVDADDDLTVSPSILVNGAPGETWHGFIERGEWLDENKQPLPDTARR